LGSPKRSKCACTIFFASLAINVASVITMPSLFLLLAFSLAFDPSSQPY
jgi:hypothetical protein